MQLKKYWSSFCQKERKIEKNLVDFLLKHILLIFLVIITFLALIARYKLRDFVSGDYAIYLSPWFDYLKENGGLLALNHNPGNYNAPYLTIMALLTYLPISSLYSIKLISVIFDFVMAGSCAYLVHVLCKGNKNRKFLAALAYAVTLFLPQVLLNGAYWGQCDSIYTSFIILALAFLMREKYTHSFILLGLAFAFKLQFMFVLPVFAIVYLVKRNFSIFNFLWIPAMLLITSIPAIVMGWPPLDCFSVYLTQTQYYAENTMNTINLYQILNIPSTYWNLVGIILTMIICIITAYWLLHYKVQLNNRAIFGLAVWSIVITTFFLPGMHERYIYSGEILAVIYYIVYRRQGIIALTLCACSWITYSRFLSNTIDFDYHILGLAQLFVVAYYTKNIFAELIGSAPLANNTDESLSISKPNAD